MKQTRLLMGMPITIDITDIKVTTEIFDEIFNYFKYVDEKYSPFKKTSEVSAINAGSKKISPEMKKIINLCEKTKQETEGYFDAYHNGIFNPSGLVKGWAIKNAADIIKNLGFKKYYVEAGGDIQANGKKWKVGIRNPFNKTQIVKVLKVENKGVATSGNYERGLHIYDPKTGNPADEIASITVVGPDIYEADRFATAAFVMGKNGISFIQGLTGFEGYSIDKNGIATYTNGFEKYAG